MKLATKWQVRLAVENVVVAFSDEATVGFCRHNQQTAELCERLERALRQRQDFTPGEYVREQDPAMLLDAAEALTWELEQLWNNGPSDGTPGVADALDAVDALEIAVRPVAQSWYTMPRDLRAAWLTGHEADTAVVEDWLQEHGFFDPEACSMGPGCACQVHAQADNPGF